MHLLVVIIYEVQNSNDDDYQEASIQPVLKKIRV